jgi:hypothetical protein
MAISMAMVLGLACTFYIYVAIRWYREVLVIRREARRASSAMVLSFARAPGGSMTVRAPQDIQRYGADAEIKEKRYKGREVVEMDQSKDGKQQKRVVA